MRIGNENCIDCEQINTKPCLECKCNKCNLFRVICIYIGYCRKEKE